MILDVLFVILVFNMLKVYFRHTGELIGEKFSPRRDYEMCKKQLAFTIPKIFGDKYNDSKQKTLVQNRICVILLKSQRIFTRKRPISGLFQIQIFDAVIQISNLEKQIILQFTLNSCFHLIYAILYQFQVVVI